MSEYCTVAGHARAEYEEKRSVFIADAFRVTSEEEAVSQIRAVREEFPDARHTVYAYLLRDGQKTRYSDDREPQGTAGLPVLEVLRKNGCTDALITVTRYFGGVLLGTGGLCRAYTAAAVSALQKAGIATAVPYSFYRFFCGYGEYDKFLSLLRAHGATPGETVFTDRVEVFYSIPASEEASLSALLYEASAGKLTPVFVRREEILVVKKNLREK